jgi:hypothetical protein
MYSIILYSNHSMTLLVQYCMIPYSMMKSLP